MQLAMPVLVPILTGSGERGLTVDQQFSPEHEATGLNAFKPGSEARRRFE
jgi:hypothetical protein